MTRPAQPSARPAQPRNNALAQIHIAAQALGMDTADQNPDSEYRRMLHAHGRVTSAAKLDHAGRAAVVQHLDHLLGARGLKPSGPAHPGKPRAPAPDRAAQIKKIEALLADAGRPWAYLGGMVRRICKVDKIEFCTPDMLHKLIAALSYDQQRRAKAAAAAALAATAGAQP